MTLRVLAYIPSPPQGVWHIGPFPLRAYALCIILGIIVAIWWGERRWRARGGQPGTILDVAMFAVPFGLVGGRLYHVATDWQKYFGADGDPKAALEIWNGGLGIWGAVLLGGVGAWIGCRVYRIPLPALGDAIAPPILLAQAIGRLGNYFNQELYGRTTELPWGLEIYFRYDDNLKPDAMNGVSNGVVDKVVHPTFLYELLWNVLIVVLLVQLDKRYRIGHGRLFALYVAGYSFGRFFVELMRDDEATKIAGIRINSFTSALVFLAAIAYFVFATKGRETAEQLQPAAEQRPWPWQLGALRAAAASGAGAGAVALSKDSADETAADASTESADEAAADEPEEVAAGGDAAGDTAEAESGATEAASTSTGKADKATTADAAAETSGTDAAPVSTGKVAESTTADAAAETSGTDAAPASTGKAAESATTDTAAETSGSTATDAASESTGKAGETTAEGASDDSAEAASADTSLSKDTAKDTTDTGKS
ncbi:prolipoprotein diacylglyceryl transferase [Nocardia vulneris]|uniref:Phosphatidylglycerol--prolipoprotein diacylglyceryl transferase n=1 Tax=Nocardia vulneris TaxID=1141657 RepID=A0ABR4Z3R6_9NOCA|nr:prolipoprotein diacylglyceryl transferase [Nocardia vulneris]KIA59672.1 diacylglyceryl transferase [Nocardia vulneris]